MVNEHPLNEAANHPPAANNMTSRSQTSGGKVFIRSGNKMVLHSVAKTLGKKSTSEPERMAEPKEAEASPNYKDQADAMNILSERLVTTLDNPRIPIAKKYATLYAVSTEAIEITLHRGLDAYSAEALSNVLDTAIPFMIDSLSEITQLFKLLSRDYTTFSHSVSVFAYSLAIAGWQGIRDSEKLHNLGFGALLHDIGKSQINDAILNKPGALTGSEWDEMKKHPQLGERMLQGVNLPSIVQEIVIQHHERADGSGYPYRLPAGFIHPLTEIVAVSDVYDALTKDRPYRQAYTPFEALQIMREEMSRKIDQQALYALVLLLGGRRPPNQ